MIRDWFLWSPFFFFCTSIQKKRNVGLFCLIHALLMSVMKVVDLAELSEALCLNPRRAPVALVTAVPSTVGTSLPVSD